MLRCCEVGGGAVKRILKIVGEPIMGGEGGVDPSVSYDLVTEKGFCPKQILKLRK